MPKYSVYAVVVGSKYIGDYEADSKEQAIEMAYEDPDAELSVSLCHQCSGNEIDEPQIDELRADEIK